ncbi:MAG: hypothetical protein ACHQIG_10770, partial [Acidimicrobiia bacterium]
MRGSIRLTVGVAAGAMALAAVSLIGLAGLAGAQTGETPDGSPPPAHGLRPQLTDTQKACLKDSLAAQGITLPVR